MNKTTLIAAAAVAVLATSALADREPVILGPMLETNTGKLVEAVLGSPGARSFDVDYNFATGALDIRHGSYTPPHIISVNPSLANLQVIALEAIGIEANVYWNQGATFENWASEMRLGFRFNDAGTENTLGAQPFPGQNTGPATVGTFSVVSGGSFGPFDLTASNYFTPASGLSVAGFSSYNDGTGNPSHKVTAGILRMTIVPAPGSLALLGMGGLVAFRRRRA